MPTIICQKCSKPLHLDATAYWNYKGDVRCTNCGAILTVDLQGGELKSTPTIKSLDIYKIPNTPDGINEDIYEAQVCHAVEANKSCIVMCRRALEQVCDDKGAVGNRLFDKIQDLLNKSIITSDLFDIFEEIRYFGNYGAHPKDDLLGGVTKEDASSVLEITIHMTKHIYEIPGTLKRLKERRKK